jgi:hypothetical protein
MKRVFYVFWIIVFAFTSCITSSDSPGTFTAGSRTYSPDSSKYLLRYGYAQGAWDGGRSWSVAILKATDSVEQASKNYSFSNYDFDDIYWQGNDTVVIAEKFTDFISEGTTKFKDSAFQLNGVTIKVIQKDPIDSSYTRKIFYQKVSSDQKYNLIVYKYVKPVNGNYFLNISIVAANDSIPKYGNFYISKYDFDCFTDIRWGNKDTLDIKVSESCYYAFGDYLVRKRPNIPYKVQIDDTTRGNIQQYMQ